MRTFINRLFGILFMTTALSCTALVGCGQDEMVLGSVEVIDKSQNALTTSGMGATVSGQYYSCKNHAYSEVWTGAPAVVKLDVGCNLTINKITTKNGANYTDSTEFISDRPTKPLWIFSNENRYDSANYSDIYVAAFGSDKFSQYASPFTITVIYSNEAKLVQDELISPSFAHVVGTVNSEQVAPPDLKVIARPSIAVDAENKIDSIGINGMNDVITMDLKTPTSQAADKYLIWPDFLASPDGVSNPGLNYYFREFGAVETGGPSFSISASDLNLYVGMVIPQTRYVIAAHYDVVSGVPSFTIYKFQFQFDN